MSENVSVNTIYDNYLSCFEFGNEKVLPFFTESEIEEFVRGLNVSSAIGDRYASAL